MCEIKSFVFVKLSVVRGLKYHMGEIACELVFGFNRGCLGLLPVNADIGLLPIGDIPNSSCDLNAVLT